ncbi:MAG: DegT/DnrJ/EryC1/StrS family aminotransferase [Ekhidna sp.]|nr:DegT/DnrJ/EryC1/StrS family aminotransferase [Ekhidna sp.]MBC6427479.1 DegT/DnrJ/EryC1/StrS family aminotransferase [Ekhidna sp.]
MKLIPLASPNITNIAIDSVVSVLRSGMLVQGKFTNQLENDICSYLNVSHCAAVSSGTASLQLALISLGVKPGDEVIVPALSYVATANVVELVGAVPVFVDVKQDFTIDVLLIEEKITDKTKVIMPVHEFGIAADMDAILNIAERHNLWVLEDAACALGSKYKEKYCGTLGDFGSFSLHPRKAITSGEGGLVVTNNAVFDKKIRTLRNHGIEPEVQPMEFSEAGFNYRLTDFQSALVLDQLTSLDNIIAKRNDLAAIYYQELKSNHFKLPVIPDYASSNWQTFQIILESEKTRNSLKDHLLRNKIQSNYGAQCITEVKFFKNKYQLDSLNEFPNALEAYNQGLAIPLYEKLTEENINHILNCINNFF